MEQAHPLIEYSKSRGKTLKAIAKDAGLSRMSLHRILRGEQNATMDTLKAISAATDGEVSVSVFFVERAA